MAKKVEKRRPNNVRKWRMARGLTQAKLGEKIGRTQATVQRIESGPIKLTEDTIMLLAVALECDVDDIMPKDPKRKPSVLDIWNKIPTENRDQASKVLEAFVKKTG